MNKKIKSEIAIGVIILLSLIVGGIFYFQKNIEKNIASQEVNLVYKKDAAQGIKAQNKGNKYCIATENYEAKWNDADKTCLSDAIKGKIFYSANREWSLSNVEESKLNKELNIIFSGKNGKNYQPDLKNANGEQWVMIRTASIKDAKKYEKIGMDGKKYIVDLPLILDKYLKSLSSLGSESTAIELVSQYGGWEAECTVIAKNITFGKRSYAVFYTLDVMGGSYSKVYMTYDKKTDQIVLFGISSVNDPISIARLAIENDAIISSIKFTSDFEESLKKFEDIISKF